VVENIGVNIVDELLLLIFLILGSWGAIKSTKHYLGFSQKSQGKLPVIIMNKNPRLAGCLSIIPGAGHFYLGQKAKAACILITFFGLILIASLIIIPFTLFIIIDAYVLAERQRCGKSLKPWEWFWQKTPAITCYWSILEIRKTGRTEQPTGTETKVLDNSRSDSTLTRTLRVSREWSYSYSVEHERASKTIDTNSLQIKDGAGKSRTVKEALRKTITYNEGTQQAHEEAVEIEVPPRKKVTVHFHWKNILETGVIVLRNQSLETMELPFSIVIGVSFDQEHIDGVSVT
jgi:hypothetical protein